MNLEYIVIAAAFLLLTGVRGSMVFGSKEVVTLEMASIFIVVIRWKYSKLFFSQLRGYVRGYNIMRGSMILYLFIGG